MSPEALKMNNLRGVLLVACVSLSMVLGCSKITAPLFNDYKKHGCTIAGQKEPEAETEYVKQGNQHYKKDEYQCQFYACDYAIRLNSDDPEAYSCRGRA